MKRKMIADLAWAIGMITVSLGAALARRHGYIDQEMASRVVALNGLYIVFVGNRMPKAFVPSACVRQVRRVGGWSMVLSGVVYAGAFAFTPMATAMTLGCGAVATGLAVTLAYCLWLRTPVRAV